MRVLAFSDLHSSSRALEGILRNSRKADALLCAGDLSMFEHGLAQILAALDRLGKPVLVVHGNHESATSMMALCRKTAHIEFIHGRLRRLGRLAFFGWGGNGFSPIDAELELYMRNHADRLKSASAGGNLVLLCHAPPYGTTLDLVAGEHAGSKSVRSFIETFGPRACVCGHLHESAGMRDRIGRCVVINPGWHGMTFEL